VYRVRFDLLLELLKKESLTWLSSPRSLNANVPAQSLITPSIAVDALLFVNTLTPALLSSDKGALTYWPADLFTFSRVFRRDVAVSTS